MRSWRLCLTVVTAVAVASGLLIGMRAERDPGTVPDFSFLGPQIESDVSRYVAMGEAATKLYFQERVIVLKKSSVDDVAYQVEQKYNSSNGWTGHRGTGLNNSVPGYYARKGGGGPWPDHVLIVNENPGDNKVHVLWQHLLSDSEVSRIRLKNNGKDPFESRP